MGDAAERGEGERSGGRRGRPKLRSKLKGAYLFWGGCVPNRAAVALLKRRRLDGCSDTAEAEIDAPVAWQRPAQKAVGPAAWDGTGRDGTGRPADQSRPECDAHRDRHLSADFRV